MADLAQILSRWREIRAKVPTQYREQRVNHPVDDKEPGKKEMPTAAHGQPFAAGQGRPGGETANRDQRIREVRCVTPIKRRMGVEDLQPAHQQNSHADDIDPMRDPHPNAVAVDEAIFGHPCLHRSSPGGTAEFAVRPAPVSQFGINTLSTTWITPLL